MYFFHLLQNKNGLYLRCTRTNKQNKPRKGCRHFNGICCWCGEKEYDLQVWLHWRAASCLAFLHTRDDRDAPHTYDVGNATHNRTTAPEQHRILHILDLTDVFAQWALHIFLFFSLKSVPILHLTCLFAFWINHASLNHANLASLKELLFVHRSQRITFIASLPPSELLC